MEKKKGERKMANSETDVAEIVKQAAEQAAQQAAQAVSQSISKLMQSFSQTTGASTVVGKTEMGDIGSTERMTQESMDRSGIMYGNIKRTYDEYQQESLESIRRNREIVDKIISDAQQYDNQRQNIANQALQNAVETANMVGKQGVRHSDIAIDRQWNVDEQGYTVDTIIKTLQPTLESVVAKVLADMASAEKKA